MKTTLQESAPLEVVLEQPEVTARARPSGRLWRLARLVGRFAGGAAITVIAYTVVIRPWHLRWGTTGHEAEAVLPGDELVPGAKLRATHAITIDAPAGAIWPWLVQMGQGRGGLYSYDWLE